jgi:hypothetical protein
LRRVGTLEVAAILIAGVGAVFAQAPTPTPITTSYRHRILGVFDEQSDVPIEGAEVIDALNHVSAQTTTGTDSLIFLPDGGSVVQIKKVGYQPVTLIVEMGPADTIPLTLTLKRVAVDS